MPKRVITFTVFGRPIHFKPTSLGMSSLIHPMCKTYTGEFHSGTIFLQSLKSTYYTLSLVLARLKEPTTFEVDTTSPGKCLCYAIEESLTIQYDDNSGLISIPTGRFNILPIYYCKISLQAGTSAHIFVTLPDNCYPDMEFRFPYLTSVTIDESGSPVHRVILRWPAASYENEAILNKIKLLLIEDYSSNKNSELIDGLMADILSLTMNCIVDTENLVHNFN